MRLFALVFFILAQAAHANVVGVDTQNFNPTNDGLDFVTVHSSKTLTPGLLNFGYFLNYAVNTLPNYEDKTTQSRTNFRDSLLSSDTNFGLGVAKDWEIGLSFPTLLAQSVKSDLNTYSGRFTSTGVTEFRLMTKYRLLGDNRGGLAGVFTINFPEIQNDPFIGTGAGPTYNFELAVDHALGRSYAVAFNAGYRSRHPGTPIADVPIQPLGNQYIASTAFSYFITSWDTKIIAEIFGSMPVKSQQFISDRKASTAEALLGLKTDITRSLAFHFGGGSEIIHGTSSPDWRVYTGINWVIGPIFSKPKPTIARVLRRPPPPPQPQAPPPAAIEIVNNVDAFAGTPQPKEDFVAHDVLFEFDQDGIKPEFADLLQRLAKYLMQPPVVKSLIIEGHTDSIGLPEYNVDLSGRRASNVRAALIAEGVPADRIKSVGFGAARPIANNGNFQGRALNRRVEFKVER
ncbi:MAG: OmpA family protein [Bdellovibrionales bacterium]